jgi:hypothetical protein
MADRQFSKLRQIAIAEVAMPVFGEGRMVRHVAIEGEPTKRVVSEVQMNLVTHRPSTSASFSACKRLASFGSQSPD